MNAELKEYSHQNILILFKEAGLVIAAVNMRNMFNNVVLPIKGELQVVVKPSSVMQANKDVSCVTLSMGLRGR